MSGVHGGTGLAGPGSSAETGRPPPAIRAAPSRPAWDPIDVTPTRWPASRRPKQRVRRAGMPSVPFPLLSLPTEVRLMVYRHLFRLKKPIAYSDRRPRLHSQILGTCRLVLNEARPILYGDNFWNITIGHREGLFFSRFTSFPHLEVSPLFERRIRDMNKFYIKAPLGRNADPRMVRRAVLKVSEFLSTLPSLRCLHIEFWTDDDAYDTPKFHRILESLGLLRNVPNVVFHGVPPDYAKYLADKMTGSTPIDNLPNQGVYY